MPLLYYWRPDNYRRDCAFGFGYHLNQNSSAMATVGPGDSLWAFTRRAGDGLYVLAAELIVRAVTRNPPNYGYGIYRIWGDLDHSWYFDIDRVPNSKPVIRALTIHASGIHFGQSFQGHAAVRVIGEADHRLLSEFASDLPVLERVGIYAEDEFEAQLVPGETAHPFLIREDQAAYGQRLNYLYTSVDLYRARRNVEQLQDLYSGRCQLCLFDPSVEFGPRLCHGHHIQWLCRGGNDDLENMLLVCPNHHAAIHRDDAPFDYADLTFRFSNGRVERLKQNQHLRQAI